MKSRSAIQGSVTKRLDKAAPIHGQIERERARHARKVATLLEQLAAASSIEAPAQRGLALVRIKGQQTEEAARHRDKLTVLHERLGKIWR